MAGTIRVLYVDDEPGLTGAVKAYLGQSGEFEVGTAVSAEEALADPSFMTYDAIVAGYRLPGIDGIAFLRAVRERSGRIAFLIFTGSGSEDAAMDALNGGADAYLRKGGDPAALLPRLADMIRTIVQTRRASADTDPSSAENKFATVFRSSPVPLTLVSATDGTFVDVNDAFLRGTGYRYADVVGKTATEIGIFADGNEYARFVAEIRKNHAVRGREMRCRTRGGGTRTCRFSSSVILVNRRPHILTSVEDITEQNAAETALRALVYAMVGTTGIESLDRIAQSISRWLGADCIMIGEILPGREHVKVLAMLLDGEKVAEYSYSLKGTPCEDTSGKGFCYFRSDVAQVFPESPDLKKFSIQGYAGTALRDAEGRVVGILCIMTRQPLSLSPAAREIIDIIATKAATEIVRMKNSAPAGDKTP